jgi:hypothetical protein
MTGASALTPVAGSFSCCRKILTPFFTITSQMIVFTLVTDKVSLNSVKNRLLLRDRIILLSKACHSVTYLLCIEHEVGDKVLQ